jgi:hypothetical protein
MAHNEQKIRMRAYQIWENEGRPAGRAHAHWERAESEVAAEAGHGQGTEVLAGAGGLPVGDVEMHGVMAGQNREPAEGYIGTGRVDEMPTSSILPPRHRGH